MFVIEDDAQDGPDHVDAHRSTTYVAGPYVKRGVVVSTPYNTISLVRTIEQVLGLSPLGLYDGLAAPMSDVFDTTLTPSFAFQATPSNYLVVGTSLLPSQTDAKLDSATRRNLLAVLKRTHNAAYWGMGSTPYPVLGPTAAGESDADDSQAPWCGLLPDGRVHS